LTGIPAKDRGPFEDRRAEDILHVLGGEFERQSGDNSLTFITKLPSVDKVTVLVVDDNEDLVHFYRRYTTNTRYQIVQVANGCNALEIAQTVLPELIVLDIMLPDIDGWQVLAQLRDFSATRTIPIVICSVVGRAEMALALGATLYVPKPVTRRQFIQALDSALGQSQDKALKTGMQSPVVG
jgi:CheY-like chemotaxis protein